MDERQINGVAVVVFGLTVTALLAPLFPWFTGVIAGGTFLLLGLATADAWVWQSQGLTLLLGLWPVPRERVVHHEAGHFLVAHLMGIPIEDYTLNPWSSWRRGYPPGEAGVRFGAIPPALLPRCPVLWLAGIAAESWVFGQALGGATDRHQAGALLASFPPTEREWRLRAAYREAQQLLQNHWPTYLTLVTAMTQNQSVTDCLTLLATARLNGSTAGAPDS
ncbi:hypothetical protein GlitD10_2940 [Gloeomargarita lithophora Alchichica-D10]|uniref:ATP-dependent Zn protease n=1 Tax=Gloeomargarita lithophora Alchichica-D10 TaxID=1188229 RepID=A0A1J0AH80_9CYAN|nr:hypothetical protein [Gloeomargarita lithophora]APB35285.1 hypothetical protein GlitD10_2940 [Gloeomargarita lithophora Alchichica-D10]